MFGEKRQRDFLAKFALGPHSDDQVPAASKHHSVTAFGVDVYQD